MTDDVVNFCVMRFGCTSTIPGVFFSCFTPFAREPEILRYFLGMLFVNQYPKVGDLHQFSQ